AEESEEAPGGECVGPAVDAKFDEERENCRVERDREDSEEAPQPAVEAEIDREYRLGFIVIGPPVRGPGAPGAFLRCIAFNRPARGGARRPGRPPQSRTGRGCCRPGSTREAVGETRSDRSSCRPAAVTGAENREGAIRGNRRTA